jgi:hypothetical protein
MKRAIDIAVAVALGALLTLAFDAWVFGDEPAPELIEVDLPAAQLRVMT